MRFPHVVGLAAGYDKDAVAWRGLACLGFGHLEIGTVTPRAQPGNPRPRVFRLTGERSLINRLGFPSRGAEYVVRRLQARRSGDLIVGVNLGKQRETPLENAASDYESLMRRFAPLADYLAVNISSPNTPELRRLQQRERLGPLLERLTRCRASLTEELGRCVPLLVKLSPDLDDSELEGALEAIVSAGVDGVIATNTTISRDGLLSAKRDEVGGLSGAALTERSTRLIRAISRHTSGRLPIVACGGVMDPDSAQEKLDAGATLIQLYTGMIYAGPGLPRQILRAT